MRCAKKSCYVMGPCFRDRRSDFKALFRILQQSEEYIANVPQIPTKLLDKLVSEMYSMVPKPDAICYHPEICA